MRELIQQNLAIAPFILQERSMGYQRGTQKRVKTSDRQPEPATQSQNRANHPVEAMQEMFGSRAASRQLRAGDEVANLVARSLSPVSPRVQAKPLFRGVSQEWGMAPPATGLVIQPKLTIGAPNDRYEQEADRVAEQVVQRLNAPEVGQSQSEAVIQREKMPNEEDELQMKPMSFHHEAIGGGEASPDLTSAINRARGKGQTLDASLQATMGQAMGADFSGVRIHTDTQANQLNRELSSKAFTTRQNVFFQQGAYQPGSREGQALIAHELAHVVQQGGTEKIQRTLDDLTKDMPEGSTFNQLKEYMDAVRSTAEFEFLRRVKLWRERGDDKTLDGQRTIYLAHFQVKKDYDATDELFALTKQPIDESARSKTVNIPGNMLKTIKARMEASEKTKMIDAAIFDEAEAHITHVLLRDTMPRFRAAWKAGKYYDARTEKTVLFSSDRKDQ